MLAATCVHCLTTSLVPSSHLLGIDSAVDAYGRVTHRIVYRCWCGYVGLARVDGPAAERLVT